MSAWSTSTMPPFAPATWAVRNDSGTCASRSMMGLPMPMSSNEGEDMRRVLLEAGCPHPARMLKQRGEGTPPPLRSADGQAGREDRVVVDLDHDGIVARLLETEVAEFVDQVDAVQGALGLELAVEELGGIGGVEAHRHLDLVRAGLDVGQCQEPHHVGVHDGEGAGLDVGEHAEDGVLARRGVDVDAVAGDPGQEGGFRLHARRMGGGGGAANYFARFPPRETPGGHLFLVYGWRAVFVHTR